MRILRLRPLAVAVALVSLLAAVAPQAEERQQPQLIPTRDVDITYKITPPNRLPVTERVRWSAAEQIERVDGPHKSSSIFKRNTHEVTLLNSARRTYRKLEGAARWPIEPEQGAELKRGAESVVAGQPCTEWSWTEDAVAHTLCATPEGVLLRFVVNGKTTVEARSVSYRSQRPELFQVPPDYAPALAPEGIDGP